MPDLARPALPVPHAEIVDRDAKKGADLPASGEPRPNAPWLPWSDRASYSLPLTSATRALPLQALLGGSRSALAGASHELSGCEVPHPDPQVQKAVSE